MSESILDPTEHAKALGLLEREIVIWFTTVDAEGAPHAVPVWFLWHDGVVDMSSKPDAQHVRHVRAGSPVLLHLNAGGPHGDDVVILHGTATLEPDSAAARMDRFREAYLGKYADAIEAFGIPPEQLMQQYSTSIVFTPERVQAW